MSREDAPYGEHMHAPPIHVRHADLVRWNEESAYRSRCPKCNHGILFVYRDPKTFRLERVDRCTTCAQTFIYTDDAIAGEALPRDPAMEPS